MQECPFGCFGDPVRECRSSQQTTSRYQNRINGPLFDRIDIHVEVPRTDYEMLSDRRSGEPSVAVRERLEWARQMQATQI
jgi:magnesium chelatase family protein